MLVLNAKGPESGMVAVIPNTAGANMATVRG